LGELTASIAHEINQPLGAMVNSANACVRWLAARNLERAQQSALRIVADGQRAGAVITRIRASPRTPPPAGLARHQRHDPGCPRAGARQVHRHRVMLKTHLAEPVPLVRADLIQLQQVLLNLLINAIEAMSGVGDSPRQLTVQSDTDTAPGVRVTVRDSGPGLTRSVSTSCSTPSIRPSRTAWAWGWRSAAGSSEARRPAVGERQCAHGAVFQFTVPRGAGGS
jgi:C4-dicarboxylate-specific signal transduction histidine kinase